MMIENDDDTKRQRYNNMRDITHDKKTTDIVVTAVIMVTMMVMIVVMIV
jgi:hypothetical protein